MHFPKFLSRQQKTGTVRRKKYEMDMTQGALLPEILIFSGPLILTGILQLLYNAADVVVVGQFAGATSLAAVGSTGSLINLIVNIFMGLSVGASVMVARYFGAGDAKAVQDVVHTSITVALISGFIVGLFGFFMAKPILRLMDSPDDVIDLATLYVRIYFLGMPFNLLYNFGAGILRAIGDTKRPLYYLTISGAANVALNLLLVIVFHMDVAGVAIATVVSQAISMVLVILCLMRSHTVIHLNLKKLCVRKDALLGIIRVGLPAGLQGSLFSISNVMIQSAVNSFQSTAMAGNAAASNLEGFVYTAMNSIYQADLTFASQNFGARKPERVKKTLINCLGTVAVIGLALGLFFLTFDRFLLSIYNSDPAVIDYGVLRMHIILPTYFLCGLMDVMVGQMRGIGYSILPMIVSLTGACLFRIIWIMTIFAMPQYHTLQVLYISYPVSWGLTFAIHLACYLFVARKKLSALSPEV
ncbi:MAG: MATE family efflux transporter [Clostridia bacterium]|nr:MATE family efflux transporter [Clostridia bacterium]